MYAHIWGGIGNPCHLDLHELYKAICRKSYKNAAQMKTLFFSMNEWNANEIVLYIIEKNLVLNKFRTLKLLKNK